MLAACCVVIAWLALTPQSVNDGPILVYVGPVTRGGFVDVDAKGMDSVRDIERQIASSGDGTILLTSSRTKADVVLSVIGRGIGTEGRGAVISSIQSYGQVQTTVSEIYSRTFWVETILQAGDYKRQITGTYHEGGGIAVGAWTDCAKHIRRELVAWITVNRDALLERRKTR